jgi:hypothetical protein
MSGSWRRDRRAAPDAGVLASRGAAVGRGAARLGIALALAAPFPAAAEDTMSLPQLEALPGTVRAVPVSVRDLSGTTLDEGDGPNLEIQGFSFQVFFSPAAAITASDFVQTGVTAGKNATFPVITPGADNIFVILNFDEESDPLAFTLNAAAPGNAVGELRVTIAPGATLGSTITLTFATNNAALVNDAATFVETVANGQLALESGSIFLDGDVFEDSFESGDRCAWSASVPADSCD